MICHENLVSSHKVITAQIFSVTIILEQKSFYLSPLFPSLELFNKLHVDCCLKDLGGKRISPKIRSLLTQTNL
jgi:hypothetical protein